MATDRDSSPIDENVTGEGNEEIIGASEEDTDDFDDEDDDLDEEDDDEVEAS